MPNVITRGHDGAKEQLQNLVCRRGAFAGAKTGFRRGVVERFLRHRSSQCDNNDSIVTFTDKAVEMWEVRCTLDKVQKINRLDAVILDMTCTDGEDGSYKRRELLLKLDNKVLRYPQHEILQRCSELKAPPSEDPKG